MAPVSVLMVCLGNICRSPMAEAVFRTIAEAHGHEVHVDSAGTGAYHQGDDPDSRTIKILRDNGIKDYRHAARMVESADFTDFDYVLAMDADNLRNLQRIRDRSAKNGKAKIMLFGDFGGRKGETVGDPYYGSRDGFSVAYEQVKRFSEGFVSQVLEPASSKA